MRTFAFAALLAFCLGVAVSPAASAAAPPAAQRDYQPLPKPGERIPLDAGHYFTYGFDKPPKLGMAIMRVEIFSRDGNRDTSFVVKGDADMPSMRGAHASGDKEFALSAKGVYLMPVRLVMPGDWEVRFTFVKKGKTVFRGAYLFDL
ncbi:MAG: FixH family protein [Geobacteraceae bacterium]|nr:FixH family protein [Geobacteraceae bacterium]